MKNLFAAIILGVSLALLAGCPTAPTAGQQIVAPKTMTQTLYTLEVSLTTATNALADMHAAGVVVGPNYDVAVAIERRASQTLRDVKAAAAAKDANKVSVLLVTLSSLIDQIAVYNGGKK